MNSYLVMVKFPWKELLMKKVYTMCVYDPEGNILETGVGPSKKKAEQIAAKNILVKEGIIES